MNVQNPVYMNNDLMAGYDLFIETLQCFPQPWLNDYFNTLRKLLQDLSFNDSTPQLVMSVTKDKNLHINIGQRWVSKPFEDRNIGLILGLKHDAATLQCEPIGYFTKNGSNEAQWVSYQFDHVLPPALYNAWLAACIAELYRVKTKSGFRKYHSRLFYDVVMNDEARKEIMAAAFSTNNDAKE